MSRAVIGGDLAVAEAAFASSRGMFERVAERMQAPDAAALTHSQLEELLTTRMREVTLALYQDHLRLRELTEQRLREVVDAAGIERTRIERGRSRQLFTVFGKVTVGRIAYRGTGLADLHPADAVLNLPDGLHSHGVARLAATEACRGSFAEAAARVTALTGSGTGPRQIAELIVAAAADIDAFYDQLVPTPATDANPLILTVDGKGVVIRPEALREDTAKAAATHTAKMKTRLGPGEKNGRKRIATLGAVYDIEPRPRTVDDVIADPDAAPAEPGDTDCDGKDRHDRPRPRSKWLCGSVETTAADVIKAVFDQAESRDPEHRRPWAVLVDGARHPIEAITAEAARRNVEVTIVIDLIHVLEYLWTAAWCLHTSDQSTAAEAWVARHARTILAGRATDAASTMDKQARTARLPGAGRKGIDEAIKYLTNKADHLRYDTALRAGWPIATGVIEGACRHLVKDRLDITGARWGLAGAEAVLKLRALHTNGDFDAYWAWHEQQEFARNHQSRYRDQLTLPA
ncbi:ISKra4 family transposase [Streptomyces mirabilis]